MPIIAISADSPEQGGRIAQKVAETLGWDYLGRNLLTEVANRHNLMESNLLRALDEPPGLLSMRPRRRQQLLTHIKTVCLERLQSDNVVCYGLGAHLYLQGVSHVLRVRVISDLQARATGLSQSRALPPERAARLAKRREQESRRWSLHSFGADETDAGLYDLVISLSALEPDKAVEIICDAAGYPKFQPMTYSRKCLADKVLASKVREILMARFPDIRVQANDGTVVAQLQALKRHQRRRQEEVRRMACQVPGVEYLEVHVIRDFFGQAAESGR